MFHRRTTWNDGFELDVTLGDPWAPHPVANRHLCSGGSKGGTSTNVTNQSGSSTTTIPPEVLARYNAVNAQAEQAAAQPFQTYGGEFVAPVNSAQQGGIDTITGASGSWAPYFAAADQTLGTGLGLAGSSLGSGVAAANVGNANAYGLTGATGAASQPYNTAAGGLYNTALGTGQAYNSGATGLALAGTNAVDPSSLNVGAYMNPYESGVVDPVVAQLQNQFGQQKQGLTGTQIQNGTFGSDRGGVGQAVLANQQDLALGSTLSGLLNQNYSQALGAAQQQQGVGLGAAQANRAALQTGATTLAGIGNQAYTQGTNTGTATQGLGNQVYNQGLGLANQYLNIGNTAFGQGNTAAGTYGNLGLSGAQAYQGLGTGNLTNQLTQGQAAVGAGTVQQQTQQAQDTAEYNQFLQQQGYPFQVAQFLAGIAEGTGALSGSTTNSTASGSGTSTQPTAFFSDERLKENVRVIGATHDGIPIVSFRYKGHPDTHVGMLAQDVEKKRPEAVGMDQGYKTVDYDAATRLHRPANDDRYPERARKAGGGGLDGGMDNLVALHQQMYPGDMTNARGIGAGPRGMQLAQPAAHGLIQGPRVELPKVEMPKQQEQGGLGSAAKGINDATAFGKNVGSLYSGAKDALVGSPATKDAPATGGLIGSGGSRSNPGWIDRQLGSTSAPAATPTAPAAATPSPSALPPPSGGMTPDASSSTGFSPAPTATPVADAGNAASSATQTASADLLGDESLGLDAFAARGGRIHKADGGGLPYDTTGGYVPDSNDTNPTQLLAEQKGMQGSALGANPSAGGGGSGGAGGGGGSPLGMLSQGVGLASGLSNLGVFSGIGSAIGSLGGAAATGVAGMPFADALAAGLIALKRGGRVHKAGGGAFKDQANAIASGQGAVAADPLAAGVNTSTGGLAPALPPQGSDFADTDPAATVQTDVLAEPNGGLVPQAAAAVPATSTPPSAIPAGSPPAAKKGPSPTPEQEKVMGARMANVVAGIESSSFDAPDKGWDTIGPETKYQNGTVDRPYGKFGVMGTNVGPWTQQYYGKALTPQEFLRSPEAQKAVAEGQLTAYAKQFGNPTRAFGAWFAGPKGLDTDAKDVLGTSVPHYMARATEWYNTGKDPGAPSVSSFGPGRDPVGDALNSSRGDPNSNVVQFPQGGKGGLVPAGGIDPSGTLDPTTGRTKADPNAGFFDHGGFLDHNQREIASGLSFLGGMLSSPSPRLLGSIGSGLTAGASTWLNQGNKEQALGQSQQQIGQDQQRINLQTVTQLQGLWTDLNARIASMIGKGDPAQIDAMKHQADQIRQRILQLTGTDPSTVAVHQAMRAAQSGASGPISSQPLPAPSIGPTPTPAPAQAPPQGPAPTAPANTPQEADLGWWTKEAPRPWVPTQAPINIADYEAKMDPMQRPSYLRKLSKDTAGLNPALSQRYADQATAAEERFKGGEYIDAAGNVQRVPGFAASKQIEHNIGDNQKYRETATAAQEGRQRQIYNYQQLQDIFTRYKSGAFGNDLNEVQKAIRRVIPSFSVDGLSPADADTAIKNTLDASFNGLQSGGGAPSNERFEGQMHMQPNITQDPTANRKILAMRMAGINQQNEMYQDYLKEVQNHPDMDRGRFEKEWLTAHPLHDEAAKVEKDIAIRGATPMVRHGGAQVPDTAQLVQGQKYVLEPIAGNPAFADGKPKTARFMGLDEHGDAKWSTD